MPRKKKDQEEVLQDGVVLNYSIQISNGKNSLVDLQGNVPLPLLLHKACINQSEVGFKKIFDAIVVDPVKVQMQSEIRDRQEQILRNKDEDVKVKDAADTNDVFVLADKKEEAKNDDKQQEDCGSDTSKKGEQGDTAEESEEGEWEAPGAVSG